MDEMLRDPQENDPEKKKIIDIAHDEAIKVLDIRQGSSRRGDVIRIWLLQKVILDTKYFISWKSPSDMNPDTKFS